MIDERTSDAMDIMARFADRTGLTSGRPSRRYLWTDAFAVSSFLGLPRENDGGSELALRLIDRVHQELGRHRPDDARRGWLSGLPADEGERHPTIGGLRIGKPLPERRDREVFDPDLEWERDGQYFHYLTKWMHALAQAARATARPELHRWAIELAITAHRAFTYGPPDARRMIWKASIDLSRPLVSSMGHHDPLDGYVTCLELAAARDAPTLAPVLADFRAMIRPDDLATDDPLGLGGMLVDAWRLVQLGRRDDPIARALLRESAVGLRSFARGFSPREPASHRLAFRELGLAIGLAALPSLDRTLQDADDRTRASLGELARYAPLRDQIETFWRTSEHRTSPPFLAHEDINDVMLATSLCPDAFLA